MMIAIAAEVMATRLMRLKWWMEIGGIFLMSRRTPKSPKAGASFGTGRR
jgi:hypothetical protein